jgi:hypothetical protein
LIETVPPAEAAYIDAEEREALSQRNTARLGIVKSHRFYHPHQVLTHYKVMKDNLEAARMSNSTADQVIYLSVVLARHADLAEALEE